MTELKLNDDFRRIGLSKRKAPKLLLSKLSALNIQYGINITATNKCAVILWAGQNDYTEVMIIAYINLTTTKVRPATPEKVVHVMHTQW